MPAPLLAAAVANGGEIMRPYLVQAILDLPAEGELWFSLNNAALTRIDLAPKGISVQYANRVDHLPAELIT